MSFFSGLFGGKGDDSSSSTTTTTNSTTTNQNTTGTNSGLVMGNNLNLGAGAVYNVNGVDNESLDTFLGHVQDLYKEVAGYGGDIIKSSQANLQSQSQIMADNSRQVAEAYADANGTVGSVAAAISKAVPMVAVVGLAFVAFRYFGRGGRR